MATVTTSHYNIYKYWSDKYITPDGRVINKDDTPDWQDKLVVDDDYCPRCWACGRPIVRDSKIESWVDKQCLDVAEESNLKRIWNSKECRAKLNRCHIVPGALGGEDSPSNLFLLCEDCHVKSPDTIYPSAFFKWVMEQRKKYLYGVWHPNYVLTEVDKLLIRDYGVGLIEILNRIEKLGGRSAFLDLQQFMKTRVGLHCTTLVESSAIVVVAQWVMQTYVDLSIQAETIEHKSRHVV